MINTKQFFLAIDEITQQKGISQESVYEALEEAFRKAVIKKLGGGDDAVIEVVIDREKALIEMNQIKKVVDKVEDDYLEIELKEARKKDLKFQIGDDYKIPFELKDATKLFTNTVKSVLHQKISEAEKLALYETYKDKTGEMITGIVEKYDERSVLVNIGRTSVYLTNRELIGEESFETGQQIRLYVAEVAAREKGEKTQRGTGISVTRAHPGFIKRLFEEEVHEIYDGTVMIKAIAREAGLRTKVAVYSDDPNVDPTGACIGHDGGRIKKILSQLGNAREREKIDVIHYINDDALFIVEALRPAHVLGVQLDKENKTALAVVQDEQLSLAIGRKGANARLANKITGYEIDIKEEKVVLEYELEYTKVDMLEEQAREFLIKEQHQRYIDSITPTVSEEVVIKDKVEEVKEEVMQLEETPVSEEVITPPVVEEPQIVNVKVTTNLFELERELEKEKEKAKAPTKVRAKRPPKISEEEVNDEYKEKVEEVKTPVVPKMEIYSEEELAQLDRLEEEEVEDDFYDDIDYDDYDDYYDDEN